MKGMSTNIKEKARKLMSAKKKDKGVVIPHTCREVAGRFEYKMTACELFSEFELCD
jgi:hypothetical protein